MERTEILDAIYESVAEAYDIDKSMLNESSVCKDLPNHYSSNVLKMALFIGENLDQDDDISFEEVAACQNLGEVADMAKKKYNL